ASYRGLRTICYLGKGQSIERTRGRKFKYEDEDDYGNDCEQPERSARKRFRRSTRRPVGSAPHDTHEYSLTGPTRSFETRLIVVRTRPLVLSSSNRHRTRCRMQFPAATA